jgi:predicted kinase
VYEEALRRARVPLGRGESVILDGTWRDPEIRARANHLAMETHSAIVELLCTATTEMVADRIQTRQPGNSEVTPEIAAALAAQENPWDTASRVDTLQGLEHSLLRAQDVWRRATRC